MNMDKSGQKGGYVLEHDNMASLSWFRDMQRSEQASRHSTVAQSIRAPLSGLNLTNLVHVLTYVSPSKHRLELHGSSAHCGPATATLDANHSPTSCAVAALGEPEEQKP